MSAHATITVPRPPRRRLYAVAAVAIAVVAASILLAIGTGGNRDQPASSPTTQEQRYAQAISQLTPEELSAAFGINNPDLRALTPTIARRQGNPNATPPILRPLRPSEAADIKAGRAAAGTCVS